MAVQAIQEKRPAPTSVALIGLAPLRLNNAAFEVFIAVAAAERVKQRATVYGIARITGRKKNASGVGCILQAFTRARLMEERFESIPANGQMARTWVLTAAGWRVLKLHAFTVHRAWQRLRDSGLIP